jgi:hypothetical protein
MANKILNAVSLDDLSGICSNHSQAQVIGLCIKSALAGSLTIGGVTQASGAAQPWVVPSTTAGYVAAPGTGMFSGSLTFTYANAADQGKAVAIYQPL